MEKWQTYHNYRKYPKDDGTFRYVITVDGEDVEVSEAVYREYASSARKMKYMECDLKRDRVLQDTTTGRAILDENEQPVLLPEREVSLEKLMDEDWDYPSDEPQPEEVVMHSLDNEALRWCLGQLDEQELALISALFFEGLTEKEYAGKIAVKQQSINERKQRILRKMKNILSRPC